MEYNDLPESPISHHRENDTSQIFRTLRNIDLNLLTIFEAVYVHKGIVNAAKVLNLTPSAISQSIQKLRTIFPDPLFIRKGQGVTPTAYALHLHEYISQGLESILGALDLTGSYDKQRTITIGTPPSIGAVIMPEIYKAMKHHFPQLLIRNIPVVDAPSQLGQFQTDLIIDSHVHTTRTLSHHVLFRDNIVLACRDKHPLLKSPVTVNALSAYEYTMLMTEGHALAHLQKRLYDLFPNRQVSFSSYNLFTTAALIGSSDLLGLMPGRFFAVAEKGWHLKALNFAPLEEEQIEFSLHYNKLSLRDPVLQNLISIIRQTF
ncbi:YbeF family transcriptional regulator [Trabulsiella odontotermitis]|uniref:YbeF family transcriptional regulator n=1 Tax=Trabulsiella odontotermitis TaxID=379893 RepID=UPI000675F868|nr:YbeF family transcriptional regulator [Trabulsiella odontotermitis]